MRGRVGLLFVLVALVLTSCARNEIGQNPASPAVSEVTSASNVLLEFGRQGGLKGADDHLVVNRDGTFTLTRRSQPDVSGQLTPDQLAAVQQTLAASNFKSIPHVNKSGAIADGYTYRIVYDGYEVLAEDGDIPPALKDVISTLNALLSR